MTSTLGTPRGGGMGPGRALAVLAILGTAVEFLLGMAVNLYSTCLPPGVEKVFLGDPCSAPGLVEAHVLVGVLLGLVALGLLFWAVRHRSAGVIGPSFGGFFGVLIAAIGGYEFLGPNSSAAWSFLMAVGFLIAAGAYSQAASTLAAQARGGGARRWSPTNGTPPA